MCFVAWRRHKRQEGITKTPSPCHFVAGGATTNALAQAGCAPPPPTTALDPPVPPPPLYPPPPAPPESIPYDAPPPPKPPYEVSGPQLDDGGGPAPPPRPPDEELRIAVPPDPARPKQQAACYSFTGIDITLRASDVQGVDASGTNAPVGICSTRGLRVRASRWCATSKR